MSRIHAHAKGRNGPNADTVERDGPDTGADVRNGLDADAEAFFEAMQRMLRAYQFRDREETCRCGISVTACYALEHIAQSGPVTVKELAAALYLDKSTASRVAASMEADGLVGRTSHATDRRALWLAATRKGRQLHEKIRRELMRLQRPLIAQLEPETRRKVTDLLRALTVSATQKLNINE